MAAPTLDNHLNSTSFTTVGSATLSANYTVNSSSNGILIVCISSWNATNTTSASSVKFNGISLTKLGGASNIDNDLADLWYLLNPPAGTFSVAITYAISNEISATVSSWNGVNQSTPFGTLATKTWTSAATSPQTLVVTSSSTDDVIVDNFSTDSQAPNTASTGPGQIALGNNVSSSAADTQASLCSYQSSSGSNVTMEWSWTGSSASGAYIGAAIHGIVSESAEMIFSRCSSASLGMP